MTGTAMSANMEQLMGASPHAGWDVVRALLCDVSEATIRERSGLWTPMDAPLGGTKGGGGADRVSLRGAETSAAPDLAASATATDTRPLLVLAGSTR